MIKIDFSQETRDAILEWLHVNVDANCKPNFEPNHGSFLCKTTTWRSMKSVWLVTQHDYNQKISVQCFDPEHEKYILTNWP